MTAQADDVWQGLRLAAVAIASAVIVAAVVIGAGLRLAPGAPPASPLSPTPETASADRPHPARP